jgi:hypothetical protein
VYAPFNYRSDILMKKKSPKWDIFAGNVHGSGGYVLTFSLVLLLFAVGFSVMIKAYAKRWEPEVYLVTAFTEPSVKDHDLTVVSAMDGKSYVLSSYEEKLDSPESFFSMCDGQNEFSVGYAQIGVKNRRNELISITNKNGEEILTLDTVNTFYRKQIMIGAYCIGGAFMIWVALMSLTIIVGRHPDRFSPRVVKLFFRSGHVKKVRKTE